MNFLHLHRRHAPGHGIRIKKRTFWIAISIVLAFLFAFCIYILVYGYQAYTAAADLKHSISALQADIQNKDLDALSKDLVTADVSAVRLKKSLKHVSVLSYIPYVGTQYRAANTLVHSGHALIQDAQQGISVAQGFIRVFGAEKKIESIRDVTEAQKGILLGLIQKESGTLRTIQDDVLVQHAALDAIDTKYVYGPLADAIKQAQDGVNSLVGFLNIVSPFLDKGPAILGYPTQKTYLFLMQNNSEVRATGGFIGNYGILKLHNGEIKDFTTDNIYNLDNHALSLQVSPPAPFAKYFKTNKWFLRDSNWSPDFKESAEKAIWFYQKEGGRERIDGVITITQDFIVPLLRFTGPIDIDGVVFTADNFEQELQYQVEKGYDKKGIPERDRKEILGPLSDRILQRIYKLPPKELPNVMTTVQRLIQERQLMMYFQDPSIQQYARSQNWTGELQKTDGDFVMVVDSNMAALKTDLVMDKYIDYTLIQQKDGSIHAKVDLNYTNNGTFTWFTTRYRDWVRIYVPDGSTLVSSDGAMEKELSKEIGKVTVGKELDKTYFGAYIVVEPKATKHFSVEYILPPRIADQIRAGRYQLTAQKQSGVSNQQFKAKLTFTRPVKGYDPAGFFNTKTDLKSVQLQSDLRVDRFFSVMF